MPPLGAHMSIAGGVDQAIDRARSAGCTALQIFLKNNNQWAGKPMKPEVVERFRAEIAKGDLGLPIAHASYLVNLASTNAVFVEKSIANLADDIERVLIPRIAKMTAAAERAGDRARLARIQTSLVSRIRAEAERDQLDADTDHLGPA